MKKILFVFCILSVQFFLSQKKSSPNPNNQETVNRDQKPSLSLTKEELNLYNSQFQKFMAALKASDRKAMENLLSEKAKKMVTETVYKKLASDIDANKTFEIIRHGYKPLIDGTSVPMIQYKYSDDKSNEPKEVITAVFETDGKILGIKPYKIQKTK